MVEMSFAPVLRSYFLKELKVFGNHIKRHPINLIFIVLDILLNELNKMNGFDF